MKPGDFEEISISMILDTALCSRCRAVEEKNTRATQKIDNGQSAQVTLVPHFPYLLYSIIPHFVLHVMIRYTTLALK
jgi:hypothetical protein